jgi:hypothetical protein
LFLAIFNIIDIVSGYSQYGLCRFCSRQVLKITAYRLNILKAFLDVYLFGFSDETKPFMVSLKFFATLGKNFIEISRCYDIIDPVTGGRYVCLCRKSITSPRACPVFYCRLAVNKVS